MANFILNCWTFKMGLVKALRHTWCCWPAFYSWMGLSSICVCSNSTILVMTAYMLVWPGWFTMSQSTHTHWIVAWCRPTPYMTDATVCNITFIIYCFILLLCLFLCFPGLAYGRFSLTQRGIGVSSINSSWQQFVPQKWHTLTCYIEMKANPSKSVDVTTITVK